MSVPAKSEKCLGGPACREQFRQPRSKPGYGSLEFFLFAGGELGSFDRHLAGTLVVGVFARKGASRPASGFCLVYLLQDRQRALEDVLGIEVLGGTSEGWSEPPAGVFDGYASPLRSKVRSSR